MAAGWLTKRRRLRAGSLSATKRSYPTSEVRGSGLECQAEMAQERPRGATPCPRSVAAGRSYPTSKIRGGSREELPCVRGQGQTGGNTLRLRSGVAGRSHLAPGAKGGDPEEPPQARGQGRQLGGASRGAVAAQAQEGLEELSHIEGQE